MGFKQVSRDLKPWTFVTEIRYAIRKTPNGLAGALTLPPSVVKQLGWEHGQSLDVSVGDEDDAGWFALSPSEGKHRSKLKIARNEVGKYTTNTLLPEGAEETKPTHTPASRIEGNTLYLQLAE